jgi:hypothetical protein
MMRVNEARFAAAMGVTQASDRVSRRGYLVSGSGEWLLLPSLLPCEPIHRLINAVK